MQLGATGNTREITQCFWMFPVVAELELIARNCVGLPVAHNFAVVWPIRGLSIAIWAKEVHALIFDSRQSNCRELPSGRRYKLTMATIAQEDVLAAVLKLLTVETFQDVGFVCSDGRSVRSNRAFLAARCDYFDKLLYGGLCEAGCTEIRLQAPSEAFRHILYHLHTGSYSVIEQEQSWDVVMETCALAQQYMLPGVVEHIAGRAMTDLQPDSVGLALSFALKHDLQPVIKNIWRSGARLLQHPLHFDSTFTADAVCFCLQHTSWLNTPQCATSSCGILDRMSTASSALSLDGNGNGTSNGRQPCMPPSSFNMLNNCSSAAREATAYDAVLAWIQQQVACCEHCQRSRRVDADTSRQEDRHATASATLPLPKKKKLQATEPSSGARHMNSSSYVFSSGALHPGGWAASGSQSPFKTVQSPASPSSSRQYPGEAAAGTEALARGGGSDSDSDSTCFCSVNASCTTAAPASSESRVSQSSDVVAQPERQSAVIAAAGDNISSCNSCCCEHHESVLLQLLARLNWHLLDPSALDRLESLALLQPASLLGVYRAHQRCSHLALHGSFNNLTLAGQTKGLRCFTSSGEQVLECQSPCHLTAIANLSFTSGQHCWQFVIRVPCDLVWLGVGTDGLVPDIWGGKQSCGWFYGSNDALCHHRHSDRRAYEQHCGFGKWSEGTVVDVHLDMDAREVWFSMDGSEARLGFSGLPDRVYPAVSLRAPAEVVVRFRAASWLMGQ